MKQKSISQEGLKLIACITMLLDHIGAVLVYEWYISEIILAGVYREDLWNLYLTLRLVGRIAFPIYCCLLVDGAYYTRNIAKYRNRMILGLLLSEIPFNLAFSGTWVDFSSTSVMVTLWIGLVMIEFMGKVKGFWKLVLVLPFFWLAEALRTDYAGNGILIIAMLALTKGHPKETLLRTAGFTVLLWFGATVQFGAISVPMELFGLLALVPILCYKGKKRTHSKALQWAFYLFYPVHLTALWLVKGLLFG